MEAMSFRGRWVLVTGASAGLGRAMARDLATRHGANLVIAARRADRLEELAAELRSAGSQVVTVAADLGTSEGVGRVAREATNGRQLYGAVLNAAITHLGEWDEQPWESCLSLLELNVIRTVELTRLILSHLEQGNQGGGVMLIGSIAGITAFPYQSVYSGTKAFINTFGRALHHEMQPRGISVTTLMPGGIETEMTAGKRFNSLRAWLMPVDVCASEAIDAFRQRRYTHSPGLMNMASAALLRAMPQRFLSAQLGATYFKSLSKNR
jgi:uncharacterized protein